ncbi:hypothetical protein LCGC14_1079920 [marine sediment metagenome]|uniref:Uncharacterized protein n=1 Tax=marine sediment metagenome TaxID=412755 RepID=A0A0F9MFP8_9ZZZZ
MGYTHYWRREKTIDPETFSKIVGDFRKLLPLFKTLDIQLVGGMGDGEPKINDETIWFNGNENCGHKEFNLGIAWPSDKPTKFGTAPDAEEAVDGTWFAGLKLNQRTCGGDCSHETFDFSREMELQDWDKPDENGRYFDFTKTAFKPYDLAVNAALIIIKHYLGDKIAVVSDGEMKDWQDAIDICQNAFGYGKEFTV